jgi:hypothetical protein
MLYYYQFQHLKIYNELRLKKKESEYIFLTNERT